MEQQAKPTQKSNISTFNRRKWNYIIPTVVFVVFYITGKLVDRCNQDIGFLALSAFPLIFVMISISDIRKQGKNKFSAYLILFFSILVICALIVAVYSQLGQSDLYDC